MLAFSAQIVTSRLCEMLISYPKSNAAIADMGTQSTAKTVFLLVSMLGWLIVGAALMYLFPVMMDGMVGSDQTHLWMENLTRGGYAPSLGMLGGGTALLLTMGLNLVWYRCFEGRE